MKPAPFSFSSVNAGIPNPADRALPWQSPSGVERRIVKSGLKPQRTLLLLLRPLRLLDELDQMGELRLLHVQSRERIPAVGLLKPGHRILKLRTELGMERNRLLRRLNLLKVGQRDGIGHTGTELPRDHCIPERRVAKRCTAELIAKQASDAAVQHAA